MNTRKINRKKRAKGEEWGSGGEKGDREEQFSWVFEVEEGVNGYSFLPYLVV